MILRSINVCSIESNIVQSSTGQSRVMTYRLISEQRKKHMRGMCSCLAFMLVQCIFSHNVFAQDVPRHSVDLESRIVGDKEQPAVSYFVPWQDVGTPDKLQWNIDRKHDNTLDLLDRDVMLRSMTVYSQMNMENPN